MSTHKKISDQLLIDAVSKSFSMMGAMRLLGYTVLSGGCHGYLTKRVRQLGIDTSHFLGRGSNRGNAHTGGPERRTALNVLKLLPIGSRKEKAEYLRRALFEKGVKEECSLCHIEPMWNHKKLTFEVDHISGNPLDNRIENLRFVCPNCHSQLSTSHRTTAVSDS